MRHFLLLDMNAAPWPTSLEGTAGEHTSHAALHSFGAALLAVPGNGRYDTYVSSHPVMRLLESHWVPLLVSTGAASALQLLLANLSHAKAETMSPQPKDLGQGVASW